MKKLTLLFVFLLTSLAGYSQDDATLISSGAIGNKNSYTVSKEGFQYEIIEGDSHATLCGPTTDNTNTSLTNIPSQLTYGGTT